MNAKQRIYNMMYIMLAQNVLIFFMVVRHEWWPVYFVAWWVLACFFWWQFIKTLGGK